MKIKKLYFIIIGVLIIILLGVVYFTSSASSADAADEVVETWDITPIIEVTADEPDAGSIWDDFSNSTMSGYVVDGQSKAIIENITIYEPESEELFGIPFNFARFKIVSFDGKNMVDELWLMGNLGISDTFHIAFRKIDEPFDMNAGGIEYDFLRHWWGADMPPCYIGVYMLDSGNLMYSLYSKIPLNQIFGEGFNGYSFTVDGTIGMESWTNPDWRDGKLSLRKDTDPDGNTFVEVFLYNISGVTYGGAGAGFKF